MKRTQTLRIVYRRLETRTIDTDDMVLDSHLLKINYLKSNQISIRTYCILQNKLCDVLIKKQSGVIIKIVHLLADNVPAHAPQDAVEESKGYSFEILPLPPDLTISEFFLCMCVPRTQKILGGIGDLTSPMTLFIKRSNDFWYYLQFSNDWNQKFNRQAGKNA
ncbi:hypothetical protein TNCV_1415481 [Trichonephila clavipes]|nr:hypothetical protein TNCV_1415481 [Trichonephila clavipes]